MPRACSTAPRRSGSITSGGSESILMGVKSARDRARRLHPEITRPHMVVPDSAHPAFTKAADYFGLVETRAPLDADYGIDQSTPTARAITDDTVLLVGSAPEPHPRHGRPDRGARAARRRADIGFHVDSCVGGFFLPFVEKLGEPLPALRLPGARA